MSIAKEENSKSILNNFPYSKLIWPVFTLLVLLMFKNPIEKLLLGSDDVAVEILGVKIKMAKSDVDELSLIQKEFEQEIKGLNDTINQQNERLADLVIMNEKLEKKAENCPEVEAATKQFSKDVDKIMKSNNALQSKAAHLREKGLFKLPKVEIEEEKEN